MTLTAFMLLLIRTFVNWVFGCDHARTPAQEGKTYCPDCGLGILYQWSILRCGDCGQRRKSMLWLKQHLPCDRFCIYCGASALNEEVIENPHAYQLQYAVLCPRLDWPQSVSSWQTSWDTFRSTPALSKQAWV